MLTPVVGLVVGTRIQTLRIAKSIARRQKDYVV
jgi:hypothetical protein